jgi:SAM-dependent methyltransferase
MKLNTMPFHIGATVQTVNPCGLPNVYPFELVFDARLGMLVQLANPDLEQILRNAYLVGQAFGTPLAADQMGKPYADDFLSFIQTARVPAGRGLEIGAGTGYLSRRLLDAGWEMTSLEPGQGYEPYWAHYGVQVIRAFFPSPQAPGPYELVCAYGVLEHVPNPEPFLQAIKAHLAPGGRAVLSVPDCTEEIRAGDPSILFHEHFNYFDAGSLKRLIELAGMKAKVVKSRFGRCLYAVAGVELPSGIASETGLDLELVASYPERCQHVIQCVRGRLTELATTGSLGIYCPARGLLLLDPAQSMRFFDDDPAKHHKFLPPFQAAIAGRDDLFARPVDHLIIMSRTFGQRIRDSLRQQGYGGSIVTLDELCSRQAEPFQVFQPAPRRIDHGRY